MTGVKGRVLVTGAAGFIGSRVCEELAGRGYKVTGIDNLCPYYSPIFKAARLKRMGINGMESLEVMSAAGGLPAEEKYYATPYGRRAESSIYPGLTFVYGDILDSPLVERIGSEDGGYDVIIHLAAQPGARYSFDNPEGCVETNVVGFLRILEVCRKRSPSLLVYASSSSVYGTAGSMPSEEQDLSGRMQSVYAVSKRCDELLADVYTRQYGFRAVGLRYFSVYGPWGRPDMAPMLFAGAMCSGKPVDVYGDGGMRRDFTYIEDVVRATVEVVEVCGKDRRLPVGGHGIYNVGCGSPVTLSQFVYRLAESLGREAVCRHVPAPPGDVTVNCADGTRLRELCGFSPTVRIKEGLRLFAAWYQSPLNPAAPEEFQIEKKQTQS